MMRIHTQSGVVICVQRFGKEIKHRHWVSTKSYHPLGVRPLDLDDFPQLCPGHLGGSFSCFIQHMVTVQLHPYIKETVVSAERD